MGWFDSKPKAADLKKMSEVERNYLIKKEKERRLAAEKAEKRQRDEEKRAREKAEARERLVQKAQEQKEKREAEEAARKALIEKKKRLEKTREWTKGRSKKVVDLVHSRISKGRCLGCDRPLKGEDVWHGKCAKKAKSEVEAWVSIHSINNTLYDAEGRNRNTTKHRGCGCNNLNIFHASSCGAGLSGHRMSK